MKGNKRRTIERQGKEEKREEWQEERKREGK